MQAAIISIGDELLIGQTVNTNASWLGDYLHQIGIRVTEILAVSDNEQAIVRALDYCFRTSEIILMTGGLGPTNDDITKEVLARYFKSDWKIDDVLLRKLKEYFSVRGWKMLPSHENIARIPAKAELILNKKGTAPALCFNHNDKTLVAMPGVPYEMKDLMKTAIGELLKKKYALPSVLFKTIQTAGIGEAKIADKIKDIEQQLPSFLSVAYLPGRGTVKLRVGGEHENLERLEQEIDAACNQIVGRLRTFVFGYDSDTLASALKSILGKKNATIATAESCTGGRIASQIVELPGSSSFYKGSIVVYSYELKEQELDVDGDVLATKGAVSEEVVEQMAKNLLTKFDVDYALSASGIAGPTGATPDKPVGTVWIGLASKKRVFSKKYQLTPHRDINIPLTANLAMNDLRRFILGEEM